MRTLVVQQVHLERRDQALAFGLNHRRARKENPGADFLVIDNASKVDPCAYIDDAYDWISLEDGNSVPFVKRDTVVRYNVHRHGDARTFVASVEIARTSGYQQVAFRL